jgi:hypothetical protein
MNIAGFMAVLETALSEAEQHGRERMEKATKLIEAEAKRELGEYQSAAGPFAAWPPLAERTLKTNVNDTPGLVTGGMRDSIASTVVSRHEGEIGSNDTTLLWFELGTKTQPPRSVLGTAAVHKEKQVVHLLGHGVLRTLIGGGTETEF